MKYKIIASCLVIIVSAFSFAHGDAQVAHTDHATSTIAGLTTNLQTTTVGSTNWGAELTVPAGTATSWLLSYKNDTTAQIPKVVLRASMPLNHTLVPGSVMLFDANFPSGYVLPDTGLFNEGIDVGTVNPGINGFIRFRAVLDATTPCGVASTASASIEANNATAMHQARVSTPACVVEAVPAPTTSPPQATPTQPQHDASHSTQTTSAGQTPQSSTPIQSAVNTSSTTSVSSSVTATSTTSAQIANASTHDSSHSKPTQTTVSSSSSSAPTQASTSSSNTAQNSTTSSSESHSTSHAATNRPVTNPAPQVATAQVANNTSHSHDTPTPAPTPATKPTTSATQATESHTSHSTSSSVAGTQTTKSSTSTTNHTAHTTTLPKTGGNPIWLVVATFAFGYIIRLLHLRKRMYATQQV